MIASVDIKDKTFGDKVLFKNLSFSLQDGEKVGLIGRNGAGKSSLFKIIAGQDKDYQGEIILKKGASIMATAQEHHDVNNRTVLEYILEALPEFIELKHIIETYPETMGSNMRKIHTYSEALERFEQLGYYTIESEIAQTLETFQLDDKLDAKLGELSGGQKRLIEVAKIMQSRSHIALIDEPTNHMDYLAKRQFIDWFNSAKESILVITHDRDVLHEVDRIIEIKDHSVQSFAGNYDAYLKQNARSTSSQMNEFDLIQRRIVNLKAKVIEYQRFKEKARDPGTIQRFKRLEQNTRQELAELQERQKPTFWIDKDSVSAMGLKTGEQYEKFKTKNIRVQGAKTTEGHGRVLLDIQNLSVGYGKPLFKDVSFQLKEGEIIELHGRNGVGKTTLVHTLLATAKGEQLPVKVYGGEIRVGPKSVIGVYDQEISGELFDMNLQDAITHTYLSRNLSIGTTKVRQLMSDYLFTVSDGELPVRLLSGGQKARLQLIAMMAENPSLLVLDEPTNHLDLPSIEELEHALVGYKGAILYVSHDSYFRKALGGKAVIVEAA
jgi:ATP-binding cassette, subfamily F, member 3